MLAWTCVFVWAEGVRKSVTYVQDYGWGPGGEGTRDHPLRNSDFPSMTTIPN